MRDLVRFLTELRWLPILVGALMVAFVVYIMFADTPDRRARAACLAEGYTRFEYTYDHLYCIKSVDGTDVVKPVRRR